MNMESIIEQLRTNRTASREELVFLLENCGDTEREALRKAAQETALAHFGNKIYIRGLIEISSVCKNDCFYCGLRRSNGNAVRYRLTKEQILSSCEKGYALGFRTFVLQGGEDGCYTDEAVCDIVRSIKERFPDCAVTLSLGERGEESFRRLRGAGADRYLLLADDLLFLKRLEPQMCGIGPFIPHKDTDFRDMPQGSLTMTLTLLAIIRLMHPRILLPATTALGTIHPKGREMGILYGANVVMPNLSPKEHRKDYALYDNKICTGDEAAECIRCLSARMRSIGYQIVTDRGDYRE